MPKMQPAKKQKKHYHILRLKRGQNWKTPMSQRIFHCQDPECFYYTSAYSLIGKRVTCISCFKDFIAFRESLIKVKVHCEECTRSTKAKKKTEELHTIEERLKNILQLNENL